MVFRGGYRQRYSERTNHPVTTVGRGVLILQKGVAIRNSFSNDVCIRYY